MKTAIASHGWRKRIWRARIVTDFHSADAAAKAAEDWAKQFQKGEAPEDILNITVRFDDVANKEGTAIRADRLLVAAGLASSVSEANRKIDENAVRVNGEPYSGSLQLGRDGAENTPLRIQLGRKIRKVLITRLEQ